MVRGSLSAEEIWNAAGDHRRNQVNIINILFWAIVLFAIAVWLGQPARAQVPGSGQYQAGQRGIYFYSDG
jgi:hypothetical protein